MADLLAEIWPAPEPVQTKKKIVWNPATGDVVSEAHQWLQPIAEEIDWDAAQHLNASPGQTREKKGRSKQSADPVEAWGQKPGVDKKQAKAMKGLVDYLRNQTGHEAKLSSLCNRFHVNKKVISKFQEVVEVHLSRTLNEEMVRLVNGWSSQQGGKKGGGGGTSAPSGSGGKAAAGASGWSSSAGKGAAQASSAIDRRCEELCRVPGVGCQLGDFDGRVRRFLAVFERRRGKNSLDLAFEMLAEWCCKKERSSVRSWGSYLMVLLRNWEQNTYEQPAS